MTNHLTHCAVTGQPITAGDRIVRYGAEVYAVSASVDYTPELRAETEARLFPVVKRTRADKVVDVADLTGAADDHTEL